MPLLTKVQPYGSNKISILMYTEDAVYRAFLAFEEEVEARTKSPGGFNVDMVFDIALAIQEAMFPEETNEKP